MCVTIGFVYFELNHKMFLSILYYCNSIKSKGKHQ